MKKTILTILTIFLLTSRVNAFLGIEKMFKGLIHAEVSAVKQDIQGDINGFRADIKGDVTGVKTDIQKLADIQVKMDAKLTNTMTGIAGVDNKITTTKTSVGGNMTTTTQTRTQTTNDTSLMKAIIGAMSTAIMGLIGYIKILSNQRAKVETRLMDFMNKQEEGQNAYIAMLEKIANKTFDEFVKQKEVVK